MKKHSLRKLLSVIGCMVLIAAMALSIAGCGSKKSTAASPVSSADSLYQVVGEGATVYYFIAVDLDGNETKYEIHTDEKMVGDALLSQGLIAGDDCSFGLYVTTVNGITLDYDKDGMYWCLLIDGEYSMTVVDMTEAVPGTTYTFIAA